MKKIVKPKAVTAADIEKANDTITRRPARYVDLIRPVIVGPPRSGKSWFASTFSRHHKGPLPKGETVYLDDLLWVGFDDEAIDGIREAGYELDEIDPNLPYYEDDDLIHAPATLRGKAEKWIKKKREELGEDIDLAIVVDTVSSAAFNIEGVYTTKEKDSRDAWRYVQSWHRKLFLNFKRFRVHIFWLCHVMNLSFIGGMKNENAAEAQARIKELNKTTAMPGGFSTQLQVGGKSKEFYIQNSSIVMPIVPDIEQGKNPNQWKRYVYPFGKDKVLGGSRFTMTLGSKEPANARAILNKLRHQS